MAKPLSATQLLSALRAEGLRVKEYRSWRTHNRNAVGPWGGVNGVLIHHTAGRDSLRLCYEGRSDLPGPLCHTHLAKDGTATMVGHGRANHAGRAAANAFNAVVAENSTHPRPSASSGTVDGNQHFYGLEIENLGTKGDPYPEVQYDAAVRWAAAICRAHGWGADSVVGHKETSIEGKPDPSFDMSKFRRDVAARLRGPAGGGTTPDEELDMDKNDVFAAVWKQDKAPAPSSSSTREKNPTWQPINMMRELYDRTNETKSEVRDLTAQVRELRAELARYASVAKEG